MSLEDPERGVASNAELSERMARVESNVEHVVDTVDRIEASVTAEQDDLAERVEDNSEKVAPVYLAYRFGKYGIPTAGTVLAALAALGFF